MDSKPDKVAADLERLCDARRRGPAATLKTWVSLSGPGWLQSAITLGGGSLSASLYLGVLAGFSMLWLQPLAMALGIVMLSAIAYVVLSTGERPFAAINRHVNPVLGWGWALASLAASMVWCLPQYALANGVMQQNLLPGLLGEEGPLGDLGGKAVVTGLVLVLTIAVTWAYGRGSRGVRIYERTLKVLVALIVLCFFGVVVRLSLAEEGLEWGAVLSGFVPSFRGLSHPAETFAPFLDALGDPARAFWSSQLIAMQRDVMIAGAATAVGINMTFLLPYTLLSRGWNREFRGLASFDLATGMLIPFLLATSCVVIASASRFHTVPVPGLVSELSEVEVEPPAPKLVADYERRLASKARHDLGPEIWAALSSAERSARAEALPVAEKRLAAMLVKRDAFDLAKSLQPLTGDLFANVLFGVGVLAMALSTITILMLISGFVVAEMLGLPPQGRALRWGSLVACTGALGPFFWSAAAVYLAVPTSVFGMVLLPIAYWTFFLMMNSRSLLGEHRPAGGSRVLWNSLMLPAAAVATLASLWSAWSKAGRWGLLALGLFLALAVVVHFVRPPERRVSG